MPINPEEIKKEAKKGKIRSIEPSVTVFDLAETFLSIKYDFRKNIVTDTLEIRKKNEDFFSTMEDESNLYIELQKGHVNISMDKLKALLRSDFVPKFDPIAEYFKSLPVWDGVTDHIAYTSNCIHVSKSQRKRFDTQFKKMLVRSIACALDERVFNKQIFVLIQSKQNTGKTSFLRWLCPRQLSDFYTENNNFDDKDSNISITENFLINIDELATLHRAEINKLKSFISKEDDKSRRAYAARAVRRIRRASFVASTNDTEFLTDTTGNVRWLCFEINGIDFKYSTEIQVNDIWSQAYSLYKLKYDYQLSNQEVIENDVINHNFMKLPPEIEIINRYFVPASKEDHDYFLNASDFVTLLSNLFNIRSASTVTLGRSLSYLQFKKDSQYNPKRVQSIKGYFVKLDEDEQFTENIKNHLNLRLCKKTPF